MKNIFKRLSKIVDPMIGKTVIRFTTHGCQAQIHEFSFIGTIVDTVYHQDGFNRDLKFYKVEVLKSPAGEKRDNMLKREFEEVAAWYLQNIGGDFYVCYDG